MKKTLLSIALAGFLMGSASVQANPVANLIPSLLNGITSFEQEARGFARGGFSRGGLFGRSSGSSSSKAVTTRSNNSSSSSSSRSSSSTAKDADFNSSSTAGRSNYGANFGGQGRAATANMGGGSPFLSSMAGTITGMMLYSMLFPSAAYAANGQAAPQVTPESISDADLESCLTELGTQKEKLQNMKTEALASGEATDEELKQMDADLQKLTDLELTLVKEQVRRLKEAS